MTVMAVDAMIHTIRGCRVILDSDLARIYGVPTKRLNEQVKRNKDRFPEDFAFVLTREEVRGLRSQIATSNGRGGARYLPMAFTEHGALMAANVLSSDEAVKMSVVVVRAFVRMREALSATAELRRKLTELEDRLTERLDKHEQAIVRILREIDALMSPASSPKRIGFHVREKRGLYRARSRKE